MTDTIDSLMTELLAHFKRHDKQIQQLESNLSQREVQLAKSIEECGELKNENKHLKQNVSPINYIRAYEMAREELEDVLNRKPDWFCKERKELQQQLTQSHAQVERMREGLEIVNAKMAELAVWCDEDDPARKIGTEALKISHDTLSITPPFNWLQEKCKPYAPTELEIKWNSAQWRQGLLTPVVGSTCEIAGANTDVSCDQDRKFSLVTVIGYSTCGRFICAQHKGCWPTVERLDNCWFRPVALQHASKERMM